MYDNHVGRTLSRDRQPHGRQHIVHTPAMAKEMHGRQHQGQSGQTTHRVDCRKASGHGGHTVNITLQKAREQHFEAGNPFCSECKQHRAACALST